MVSVGSERNGAESAGDWIAADVVVSVPRTNARAAARFSAEEEVNAEKKTAASNDGWAE